MKLGAEMCGFDRINASSLVALEEKILNRIVAVQAVEKATASKHLLVG